MEPFVQLHLDSSGLASLTLNRPERRNALNGEMISELYNYLQDLAQEPKVRLLQLQGNGPLFCSGVDLQWMQQMATTNLATNLADAHQLASLLDSLYHFPIPTLCRVQGGAFGGAMGLVACCDLVLATRDSRFCCTEVRLGLVPSVISPYLLQAMGSRRALTHILLADPLTAKQAYQQGLVTGLYPDHAGLSQGVAELSERLLSAAPEACRQSKKLLRQLSHDVHCSQWVDSTAELLASVRSGAEAREGVCAFLAKRPPNWSNNKN